jgi:hypothetical protein
MLMVGRLEPGPAELNNGKKPQALAHCGFRVRKLIVYETYPAPVRKLKNMSGLT